MNRFLLIFGIYLSICCGQEVGEPCVDRSSGQEGRCELINNCEYAIKLLNSGRRPTKCGLQGHKPVVCCNKKTGDITREKCKQYEKNAYKNCDTSIPLIVGGKNARPKEFPHQALLGYDSDDGKKWRCGGSLISENFVLTAAHCCSQKDPPLYVLLGENDLKSNNDDANPEEYTISNIIIHPEYNPPRRYHDIALLKLSENVKFNEHVHPACLHISFDIEKQPNDEYAKFIATGWGKTDFLDYFTSDVLQKVVLQEFSIEECRNTYKNHQRHLPNGIDFKSQLCAGGRAAAKDTCSGDSGGPLQIRISKQYCTYEIVGITSFGKSCGGVKTPAVYTRVSNYIKWIEENVWSS